MTVLAQTLLNVMSLDHSSVEMNDAETRAPVASAPYRCVYFDIERTFNADRFLQIFRHLRKSRGLPHISRRKVLEKILIFQPTSTSQFEAQLAWIEKNEMVYCDIDIVIVDSIASLKRKEFDFDNSSVRSNQLNHEAALLKRMASTYEIPVLITNHVTFDEKATMGTLWFHAVNHRIRLKYVGDHHASNPTGHNGMRMVVVEKSPLCGPVSGLVQIFEGGIRDDADRES
jgi:RecA/RadA recombinase